MRAVDRVVAQRVLAQQLRIERAAAYDDGDVVSEFVADPDVPLLHREDLASAAGTWRWATREGGEVARGSSAKRLVGGHLIGRVICEHGCRYRCGVTVS